MVRIELETEIQSSLKKVYDIAVNTKDSAKWCLPVKEASEISEGKFDIKSTVGDFTYIHTENVENEKHSASIEGGIFSAMGYIFSLKGDLVKAILWGEFDDEKNEKALRKAGELLLQSLKSFAEFLEEGGNADDFDKKEITVAP